MVLLNAFLSTWFCLVKHCFYLLFILIQAPVLTIITIACILNLIDKNNYSRILIIPKLSSTLIIRSMQLKVIPLICLNQSRQLLFYQHVVEITRLTNNVKGNCSDFVITNDESLVIVKI